MQETKIDKKDKKKSWKPKFFKSSTVASTAIQKPISKIDTSSKSKKKQKNEIFVDIFEKLTVSVMTRINLLCVADFIQLKWNGH